MSPNNGLEHGRPTFVRAGTDRVQEDQVIAGSVPEHLEVHLGPISRGWSRDADGQRLPFQIVQLPGPVAGTVSFSTIGLGATPLVARAYGKPIRHEIVLVVPEDLSEGTWPSLLHVPISRGEAGYVAEHGWDAFEDRLAEADPDLSDIFREPLFV